MRLKITTKGFQIPIQLYKHLDFHLQKISQRLPHLEYDLSSFSIVIRKTAHKYYIKRHYHHALALFEGSMNLQLPKKPLIVTFKGQTINECIDRGIDRLKKELQKYKDLHFKSQSEYPNRLSIRVRGDKNGCNDGK